MKAEEEDIDEAEGLMIIMEEEEDDEERSI